MSVLSAEDLGKRYYLGVKKPKGEKVSAFRDFIRQLKEPFLPTDTNREMWALRNVSFEVERGSVVGLIGPNGAGKSTLLKILSRVIPPTEGRVVGSGRTVSLLGVGAGLQTDLTGRENVFLAAALAGMPRQEVSGKMDELIDFAGIGEFIDVPVRHYSSGMSLRLSFAIALHMRPDLLLADEVLAVGDRRFQEKCFRRILEAKRGGMSVLFVSHDMVLVKRLCDRVLYLDEGGVAVDGDPDRVITRYQRTADAGPDGVEWKAEASATKFGRIHSVQLLSRREKEISVLRSDEESLVRINLKTKVPGCVYSCGINVFKGVLPAFSSSQPQGAVAVEPGWHTARVRLPPGLLADAPHSVNVSVVFKALGKEKTAVFPNALTFQVYHPDGPPPGDIPSGGAVAPRLKWNVKDAYVDDGL